MRRVDTDSYKGDVAYESVRDGSWKPCPVLSHVRLVATPRTVARQAPLSMEFSWQESWSGLPFPPPEDLLNSGIQPAFPVTPALRWIPYH